MKLTDKLKYIVLGGLLTTIGFLIGNLNNMSADEHTTNMESKNSDYSGLFDKGSTPQNYLANGDFYSQEKPRRLIVDTSYIDKVDTAVWWYDKVLNEYPGTDEANEALKSKIRTLIGWEEGYGKDKEFYGLHSRTRGKYFPLVESTFTELEVGYPEDPYLEAFAYHIAQQYLYHIIVYKHNHYRDECKQWLDKTIELAEGKDTFYSHLAKLRLQLFKED